MRLGIMLRHFDQHEGGVKVYTRELMNAIVAGNTPCRSATPPYSPRIRPCWRGSMTRCALVS